MSIVVGFFTNILLLVSQIYVWMSAINSKIDIKSKKFYIKLLIFNVLILVAHYIVPGYMKGPLLMIITILFCKIFTLKSIKESIILAFISQLAIIIFEALILAIVAIFFQVDIEIIATIEIVSIIFDLTISLLLVLFAKLKIFTKVYKLITKVTKHIKVYKIFIFLLFVIFAVGIFCATIYFKNNITLVLIFNIIISVVYTAIILFVFNYQSKLNIITEKYKITLDSLQSQEQMINEYRIINHENKNNLRTIKGMTKNQKIIGYIESLTNDKRYISTKTINDASQLPSIGIRALIYNKLMLMNDNNIKYILTVDKKIDKRDLINLSNDDIVDICQILGVFLDNAIEETIKYKDAQITIHFFNKDNNIQINIGNINKSNLNFNNKKVLSSKSKDRGHGLQLVKKIIDKNDKISNRLVINKDIVVQELIIKIKKD